MSDPFADAPRVENTAPVLFPFQPKYFVDVQTTAQLREWERMFVEECGAKLPDNLPDTGSEVTPHLPKEWVRGETIGGCTGGWDYCDYRP